MGGELFFEKRKLTNCDNGRDRSIGIIRDGRIRSRWCGSKGSMWAGGILVRGII